MSAVLGEASRASTLSPGIFSWFILMTTVMSMRTGRWVAISARNSSQTLLIWHQGNAMFWWMRFFCSSSSPDSKWEHSQCWGSGHPHSDVENHQGKKMIWYKCSYNQNASKTVMSVSHVKLSPPSKNSFYLRMFLFIKKEKESHRNAVMSKVFPLLAMTKKTDGEPGSTKLVIAVFQRMVERGAILIKKKLDNGFGRWNLYEY